jgi:hypothetical protein
LPPAEPSWSPLKIRDRFLHDAPIRAAIEEADAVIAVGLPPEPSGEPYVCQQDRGTRSRTFLRPGDIVVAEQGTS